MILQFIFDIFFVHSEKSTHLPAPYIADKHVLPRVLKYDMISIDTN